MAREIDVARIMWPSDPVRGIASTGKPKTIPKQLDDMTTLAKDAKDEWPFPAIIVRKLTAEEATATESKYTHEALDGVHRLTVARRTKRETIAATVVDVAGGSADAYAVQVRANIGRGTDLDRDVRDAAIIRMRTPVKAGGYGLTLAEIADKVPLSLASVSRIAKGRQRGKGGKVRKTGAKRKKGTRKSATTEHDASTNGAAAFDPASFYVTLAGLVTTYMEHVPEILALRGSVDPDILVNANNLTMALVSVDGE
jgi:hypothetical protein